MSGAALQLRYVAANAVVPFYSGRAWGLRRLWSWSERRRSVCRPR